MGVDYTNHQVFTDDAGNARSQLIGKVTDFLINQGYIPVNQKEEADRSIAFGPTDRWVCIYDSTGNGDAPDVPEFQRLSLHLSQWHPVVDIYMDDSAAVHFYLCQDGQLQDQFANRKSVFEIWATPAEEQRFQGNAERWRQLILSGDPADLEQVWQSHSSQHIITQTGRVLGWHPLLCHVGYTIDYDGVPVRYAENLDEEQIDLSTFDEYHFRWPEERPLVEL